MIYSDIVKIAFFNINVALFQVFLFLFLLYSLDIFQYIFVIKNAS